MGSTEIPSFGDIEAGIVYKYRPSVYGVAVNTESQILVVDVAPVCVLPGGGIEEGETQEAALVRECREETGYDASVGRYLGEAYQYLWPLFYDVHLKKHCHFYELHVSERVCDVTAEQHAPRWAEMEEAKRALTEGAHRWAITQMLELT